MVIDPVSTGALIGLGWAGKKILGPSLDEIGGQLKLYVGERIQKIFEKVEASSAEVDLHELPKAFALKFFQSASISEDDESITIMWANLLINSSRQFDSRKILYLDILEKLSSDDACLVNALVGDLTNDFSIGNVRWFLDSVKTTSVWRAQTILRERSIMHFTYEAAEEFNASMSQRETSLPIRVLETMVPYIPELPADSPSNVHLPTSSSVGLAESMAPYDPLIRQRLAQDFSFDFIAGFQIEVGGVMATSLGIDFVRSCRGYA